MSAYSRVGAYLRGALSRSIVLIRYHNFIFEQVASTDFYEELSAMHHLHKGMSEMEAEAAFLNEAKNLPEYGIHFHKVSKGEKAKKGFIWLGISVNGLFLYEPHVDGKRVFSKFAWQKLKSFSFKKKKFLVDAKVPGDMPMSTFYTDHYRKAKYLLRTCQDFHRFQVYNICKTKESEKRKQTGKGQIL